MKKAGLLGGLSAAGAVTLEKECVKPVVQMLEPSYAEAVSPTPSVMPELSVTTSQPVGSEFKAAVGGAFPVAVWSIDVPLSASIPAGVAVDVTVDYTFKGNGAVDAKAGVP